MAIFKSTSTVAALALMTTLTLGACQTPPPSVDYRQNYPLKVESENVLVTVHLPELNGRMGPSDTSRFQRFLHDFVMRGRGRIEISAPLGKGDMAAERVRQIQQFLTREGLGGHQVFFSSSGADKLEKLTLRFAANKVIVPECFDWKTPPQWNVRNDLDSNFGCSYQRNLGLSVADPGDFVRGRPFSGQDISAAEESAPDPNALPTVGGGTGGEADTE